MKFEDDELGTKEWENKILLPLRILNWSSAFIALMVWALPTYQKDGWFHLSVYKGIIILIIGLGALSRNGRFKMYDWLVGIIVLRLFQFLFNLLVFKTDISYVTYLISILLEFIIGFIFYNDDSNFTYVKEMDKYDF